MPVSISDYLREYGWYLTEQGLDVVTDYGNITDVQKVIKRAIDCDLKEIGSGDGSEVQGNLVVQIQKLRNISAPKYNEESRGAPRMLKFSLTDGKNNYQAIEIEHISNINLNTPPGTKFVIKKNTFPFLHGVILLGPSNIQQILGGKVAHMVDKWELNKKLALHSRVRSVEEGGPPPWIPFGKKIIKIIESGKNFKALSDKEKSNEDNDEFEAQRKNAIAEAAKQGSKKIFGGGNKQLLDHSVQKIVDQGFTIEQAEHALKTNRNNGDRALKFLLKNDSRANSNPKESRESKSKRSDKKSEESSGKPSSAKISLFDFLEDKLPAQAETMETSSSHFNEFHGKNRLENRDSDRHHSKGNDYSQTSRGGGRGGAKGSNNSRGYRAPPRHQEESRSSSKYTTNNSNNQTFVQYSQKNKPPRFQRNQSTGQNLHQDMQNLNLNQQNYSSYQQQNQSDTIGAYNKFPQIGEFKNSMPTVPPFPQNRQDAVTPRDFPGGAFKRNQQNYQDQQNYQPKIMSNSRNPNQRNQEAEHMFYQPNPMDNRKAPQQQQQNPNYYASVNDNLEFHGIPGAGGGHRNNSFYNNSNRNEDQLGGTWIWRSGDRCMAKYWEDNMYYNAEVTAVSKTTCVVQFKDFHNYEEVLQVDCIPITDNNQGLQNFIQDTRRPDYRLNNRPPRFEQNQNNVNTTEYRRGGGNGAGGGGKNNYRKRGQQRTAQAIYQPPAQRDTPSYLPQNI